MLIKETIKRLEQGKMGFPTLGQRCSGAVLLFCFFVLRKAANEATPTAVTYLGEFGVKQFLKSQQ